MTAPLLAYTLIPLPAEGPEDVVVGPNGVIYTGGAGWSHPRSLAR